jgi:energy-coupling factor transporter ATP-binding protein EcfA2
MKNFRTFVNSSAEFLYPDIAASTDSDNIPKFKNINLLLGSNGSGKTTILKAIALSALSPIIKSSGFVPYCLVSKTEPDESKTTKAQHNIDNGTAVLTGGFLLDDEDVAPQYIKNKFGSSEHVHTNQVVILRRGDLEEIQSSIPVDLSLWSNMYENKSPAFLMVGYGATRRVETRENFDFGSRQRRSLRYQRVQGLFEDSYSLIPLGSWLPELENANPDQYQEVIHLIDRLLPEPFSFHGHFENREYLFIQEKIKIPFDALSDGYRSYIGWITDLLYHISTGCPENKRLVDCRGIVMVDEIDLHLHPAWQRDVIPIISGTFPNLQFIFTTHSPIVTGGLQSQNIIVLEMEGSQSQLLKLSRSVYGLNADQVLLSEYFGLDSTRAPGIRKKMRELNIKAMDGDKDASLELLKYLAEGEEAGLRKDDSL